MKNVVLIIVALLLFLPIGTSANIICNDGTTSSSCSDCHQGCCSRHGGCTNNPNSGGNTSVIQSPPQPTSTPESYQESTPAQSSQSIPAPAPPQESASTNEQKQEDPQVKADDVDRGMRSYDNSSESNSYYDNDNSDDESSDDGSAVGGLAILGTIGAIYAASRKRR